MKVIDISFKLDEQTQIYEGDPRFCMEVWRSIEQDTYMLSKLKMGTHTGTHIDAPCHYIEGAKTIYDVPMETFIGACKVVDRLDQIQEGDERVIIKGKNALTPEEARELVKKRVRLVGTERLSVGGDDVHRILLGNECVILERLKLHKVKTGSYMLCAPPLKIEADGCPVRACLIEGVL